MCSAPTRSSRVLSRLALPLFALVLLISSCTDSAEPVPADVAAQFDITNNSIADLTLEDSEAVPRPELIQSVLRAQTAGTVLRIVVAAPDGEFVSARSVVDRYGGTAISYQADRTQFEGASRDMSAEQLDRAVDAAKVQFDIGDSAAAFVDVIESEGIEERGRTFARTVLLLLLIPAGLFMLSGAWSYLQARKRRINRHQAFTERRVILTDWAAQLGPELESLRPLVAASPDDAAQRTWHDSQEFVTSIVPTLDAATGLGELDVAEMRIGRTAIKLRDLRRSLDQ